MEDDSAQAPYSDMKDARPNRIAEARKAKGWTQAQLAEAVDAHWVTISRLERGKIQLNAEWLKILGEALHVDENSLLLDKKAIKTVYIAGVISNNVEARFLGEQEELDFRIDSIDDVLSRWLIIEDGSLWPHFHGGDLLRFVTVDEDELFAYTGRICIVDEKSSPKSYFGLVETGSTKERCAIRPLSGGAPRVLAIDTIRVLAEVRYLMPWEQNDG